MWMSEFIDSLWDITIMPSLGQGKLKRVIRRMVFEDADADSQSEMLMKEAL